MSGLLLRPLSSVLLALSTGVLLVWPSAAQTNEVLLQERLISPTVFELLQQRGVTTPEQRLRVIAEACRTGRLTAGDCLQLQRDRY